MKTNAAVCFLISLFILALDQITKYYIRASLGLFDSIPVTSFFNIVHVRNTGSAFGMFRNLGNVFFIAIAFLAIVLVSVMIVRDAFNRLPFALILGGAMGNLADRIFLGHVTDFLDFYIGGHHWPAFNVADAALTLGIAFLFIKTISDRKRTDN